MPQPTLIQPEQWKPVVGFEGSYEVSDQGQVRSLDRVIMRSNGISQTLRGQMLKPCLNRAGYPHVNLSGRNRKVHHLVLEAFAGSRPEGMEACHGPGGQTDNRLANLRWGSKSENNLDQVRAGTHNYSRRTHCPRLHLLVIPNLVPSQLPRGRRLCLACQRAHRHVWRRPDLDFRSVADAYYAQIMAADEAAPQHPAVRSL